jgi:hypothetical protein
VSEPAIVIVYVVLGSKARAPMPMRSPDTDARSGNPSIAGWIWIGGVPADAGIGLDKRITIAAPSGEICDPRGATSSTLNDP